MKSFASIGALLFAWSASLQLNDPDPVRWVVLYAAAAAVCILHLVTRVRSFVPYALAAVAGCWAATLLPGVLEAAALTGTEEEREFLGLGIVAAACLVLGHRDSLAAAEEVGEDVGHR